jgi:hypothetical protein
MILTWFQHAAMIKTKYDQIQIQHWKKHNYTKKQKIAYRKANAARQAKYKLARKMAGFSDSENDKLRLGEMPVTALLTALPKASGNGVTNGVTNGVSNALKRKRKRKIKNLTEEEDFKRAKTHAADVLLPPGFLSFSEQHPSQQTGKAISNAPENDKKGGNFDFQAKPLPSEGTRPMQGHLDEFHQGIKQYDKYSLAEFNLLWQKKYLTALQIEKISELAPINNSEVSSAFSICQQKSSGGSMGLLLKIIKDERENALKKPKNGNHPVGLRINSAPKELVEAHKHYYELSRQKRWMQPTMKEVRQVLELKLTDGQILAATAKGWPELLKEIADDHVTA